MTTNEIYSVIEIEWLDSGMWDFHIEKGQIEGCCFQGYYEDCIEYCQRWQY